MTPTTLRTGPAGPFDHDVALATLAAHRIEGLHAIAPEHAELQRWIDVDIAAIAADTVLGPLMAERPGVRITRFHSAYEAALFTVIGQQVSLAAARLFGSRLIAAYGAEAPNRAFGGGLRALPAPHVIARQSAEELRARIVLAGACARTVLAIAELFADLGDTENLPGRATLAAVYGVGPWTRAYLAVRAGTDLDTFPAGDAVPRRVSQVWPRCGPEGERHMSDIRTRQERAELFRSLALSTRTGSGSGSVRSSR
ncbi:DNA-3-methyladenine glycosylase family protein [Streptomyces scopuliridis]|uniref:DNA-3-methyladenine glycosylase family protein n=1 Tax=Streptomyces scopuliridis TaxID=452529 RepID=UPI00369F68EE